MEDFSHSVVFATKTGIALLLRHQSMSTILALIHSYFTQKNWSLIKNWVEELIKRRRRDENLILYLNTCNRQEAKCIFPFHFHFQLSKDVRTRLEINKCWIPWICCFLKSRSISDKFLMNLSRSQGLFILVFYLLLDKTVSNIPFFSFFPDFNLI